VGYDLYQGERGREREREGKRGRERDAMWQSPIGQSNYQNMVKV